MGIFATCYDKSQSTMGISRKEKYLIGRAGRWAVGIGVIGTPLDRIITGGDRIGQDRGWAGNAKHRFRVNTTSTRFVVRSDDMGFAIYNGVFRVKVINFLLQQGAMHV